MEPLSPQPATNRRKSQRRYLIKAKVFQELRTYMLILYVLVVVIHQYPRGQLKSILFPCCCHVSDNRGCVRTLSCHQDTSCNFERVETFKILVLLTQVFPTTDATEALSIFYENRKRFGFNFPHQGLPMSPLSCVALISNSVSESLNFLI